jgi:hypothetical protein
MSTTRFITTPALAARVRRRLARDRQLLRRCYPWDTRYAERGDYYVIAAHTHHVVARHVSVEQLARDLGVLPENVVVEDDHTHTVGEVPTATTKGKDGAGW